MAKSLAVWVPPANRPYVNDPEADVTDRPLQLALRDLRQQFGHPVGLTLVFGMGAVLAILGPFGTEEQLGLVRRLLYWPVLVAGTYGIGVVVGRLASPLVPAAFGQAGRALLVGLAIGLALLPFITAVNWVTFAFLPTGVEWLSLSASVLGIAVIVTAVLAIVEHHLPQPGAPTPGTPALLGRLPLEKRGPLVALSVEDHYVRVRTLKGEEMLLLRLGDAIRETAPEAGLQVHRSHWVATGRVKSVRREGDRAILTMQTGPEVPASRANLPALREAGLLPK